MLCLRINTDTARRLKGKWGGPEIRGWSPPQNNEDERRGSTGGPFVTENVVIKKKKGRDQTQPVHCVPACRFQSLTRILRRYEVKRHVHKTVVRKTDEGRI